MFCILFYLARNGKEILGPPTVFVLDVASFWHLLCRSGTQREREEREREREREERERREREKGNPRKKFSMRSPDEKRIKEVSPLALSPFIFLLQKRSETKALNHMCLDMHRGLTRSRPWS